jgi:pimeloyl-ACP methyl ester carboxylesterase
MKPEPMYFGPRERRLFGWIHPAGLRQKDVGVVLCHPFGFEAMCTYRTLRHAADAFARAGHPAMRFDYDGTGDSAGGDRDPHRVRAWIESIHHAIETLKEQSGVSSVCLFGVRLGATLAANAAASRKDCHGVIAVAPVVRPKLYLRELQAVETWRGKTPERDLESSGFLLTEPSAAALGELALLGAEKPPAPRVLVIERDERHSSASEWPARLTSLGVDVARVAVDGLSEMAWDPHKARVPTQMITESVAWLSKPSMERLLHGNVVESPVFVGADAQLFGIVTHPKVLPSARRAVLLVNAGAQHRIGPGRLWVTLSRQWAERGAAVLRLDLSGLGDSPSRHGSDENVVYMDSGVSDIAEAVAYLRTQWHADKVVVIGLCGGAYHALKAACSGAGVDQVIAINQQCFSGDPADAERASGMSKAASEMQRYREAAKKVESWKKLLRGRVKVGAALRTSWRRAGVLAKSRVQSVARRLRWSLNADLANELRRAADRGVVLRFVFSEGEGGETLLTEMAGAALGELRERGALSLVRIDGADHTFTSIAAQEALTQRLTNYVFS